MEILFGVLMLGLMFGAPVLIWRIAVVGSYRRMRAHLERLAAEVGGLSVTDVVPAGSGPLAGLVARLTPWPIARGERDGLAVEVWGRTHARYERPFTAVNVTRPGVTGPAVGISDQFAYKFRNALGNVPTMMGARGFLRPSDWRSHTAPWIAKGVAWGDPAGFDRVFEPGVQALLRDLGGQLACAAFNGAGTMTVQWYGLEENAAVVRRAIDVGARCLEQLARADAQGARA
jgi:hypothetical protein